MSDIERLVAAMELRISDAEKNARKIERTVDRSYGRMRRDSRRTTRQMERDMVRSTTSMNRALKATGTHLTLFARGLAGGLVAGGVAGTVTALGRVARGVADIGREAERAGLGVEVFQELGFVAEQNRIPIDALTDGLKELNLRADEFIVTGQGPAAEAFQRLGFAADDLQSRLENPSELFTEIIGRMEQLDQAAQIRIADEIFGGTAGERFVELLDEGAAKIREQIRLAHDMGLVMDAELIERAEELDRKFNLVAQTVGNSLKRAIVEAATALAQFIDGFRAFEAQSNLSLENRLTDLNARIAQAEANERRNLGDLASVPRGIADATMQGTTQGSMVTQIRRELGDMRAERDQIAGILQGRQTPSFTTPEFTPTALGNTAGGNRGSATRAVREQTDAVRALISELEFELATVGKSQTEMDVMTALRQAGADATDEERARITGLIQLRDEERAALEATAAAHEANRNAMEYMADNAITGLMDVVAGAQSAEDAIKRLALSIADAALQSAIFGRGPFAAAFGGSSGGLMSALFPSPRGFSSGGWTGSGGRSQAAGVVHGQEYVVKAPHAARFRPQLEAMNAGRSPSSGGTSTVVIELGEGLEGRLLAKAKNQTVQIVQATAPEIAKMGAQRYRDEVSGGAPKW